MNGQISIFDITMPMISIPNKIRLIELFAGYGSQAMTLDEMGADYEHWKVVEFDKYAVASYNAVHNTNFQVTDIRNVHGADLEISDSDKYTYFLTYSFPCTDLSVAGKMKGMKKGSGTRSGLLWEVERILTEIYDLGGELPQILFMENVPQVISPANIDDFHDWQDFLSTLGYTSYVSVLNAKDYGVAQNRERTFMFSFLGEYNYKFPETVPLKKTMKDYLEDSVDEKYYINTDKARKLIETLVSDNKIAQKSEIGLSVVGSLNPEKECQDRVRVFSSDGISPGLRATDYKDPTKIVEIGNLNSSQDGIVVDCNGICKTLTAGNNNQPKTIVAMRGRNPDNPSDRSVGSPTEQRLEPNGHGICNTLTSVQKDNMVLESVRIKQATKDGYIQCKVGGVADLSYPTSDTRRGRVQDNGDTCPTITAAETGICRIESIYRIRKLIPRECGRLMAVSDSNIDRILSVVSNTQAYKQFGNSIVVIVMVAMFSNLNIQRLSRWDEIKERYI
jgi:DNA (cytosine-5)-methyltransferase 1